MVAVVCRLHRLSMTRDQQIRKALELLGRVPANAPSASTTLSWRSIGSSTALPLRELSGWPVQKKERRDLQRYYAALRRLRNAYYSLDPAIRPWFSLAETAYIAGKPTVIDREIAMAETFLDQPSAPPRRDATRNKVAVAAANDLLDWWGHRASRHARREVGQLAKILTGDLTVDLFDHLREFKRRPGPSIEKVRGADSIVYRRETVTGINSTGSHQLTPCRTAAPLRPGRRRTPCGHPAGAGPGR